MGKPIRETDRLSIHYPNPRQKPYRNHRRISLLLNQVQAAFLYCAQGENETAETKNEMRALQRQDSTPSNRKNYSAGNPNKTGANRRVNGYDKPSCGRKILRASEKELWGLILEIPKPQHKSLNRNLEKHEVK